MIRLFNVADLESALLIENQSFTHPWSELMFREELGRGNVSRCFVAEVTLDNSPSDDALSRRENEIGGYIMSWLVADELHINNLAVSPAFRGLGLASKLVEHALDDAKKKGAVWCQLEVRSDNMPARSLYRKFGFREIGVRKGYYQDGEDAVVMGKDLVSGV